MMYMEVKSLCFGFLKFFFIFEFWGLLSGEKSLQKSLRAHVVNIVVISSISVPLRDKMYFGYGYTNYAQFVS